MKIACLSTQCFSCRTSEPSFGSATFSSSFSLYHISYSLYVGTATSRFFLWPSHLGQIVFLEWVLWEIHYKNVTSENTSRWIIQRWSDWAGFDFSKIWSLISPEAKKLSSPLSRWGTRHFMTVLDTPYQDVSFHKFSRKSPPAHFWKSHLKFCWNFAYQNTNDDVR